MSADMIVWERPDGTHIVTNHAKDTVAYAKSLGWKEVTEPKKSKKTKASK